MKHYARNDCPSCRTQPRNGQRTCLKCHAAYLRLWRKLNKHRITPEQRKRANARSYAHAYRDRGKIPRTPCLLCDETKAEMHHPDYTKPLLVIWLCRGCHLKLHKSGQADTLNHVLTNLAKND